MKEPRVLHLTLKKKFFDMILSGEKKEEYRSHNLYWAQRLYKKNSNVPREFDLIHFFNGGSPSLKYPNFIFECKEVTTGFAKPEWSDNWQGKVFIIKLGKIIINDSDKRTS